MYTSSCKWCERKWKGNFEIPDSNLLGCGTVSTGKREHSAGKKLFTSSASSSGRIIEYY